MSQGLEAILFPFFLLCSCTSLFYPVIMFLPSLSASRNLFLFSGQVAFFASAAYGDAVYLGPTRFRLLQLNGSSWRNLLTRIHIDWSST